MKPVVYNANKFNEGVNVFVSVNQTIKDGSPIDPQRSFKSCIAKSWYFYKEEEAKIVEAFEKGLPVTVSGVEAGKKVATYLAEGYEIIDISKSNPDVGQPRRFEFKLTKRLYGGAPIWQGSLGAHSVAVK